MVSEDGYADVVIFWLCVLWLCCAEVDGDEEVEEFFDNVH